MPTLIAHMFISAQREGDLLLQDASLLLCSWSLALLVSASLRMASAFVWGHREGVWNAVLADQFGEQTYIGLRYCKSEGGLVCISLSAEQVACWVLTYPLCQRVPQACNIDLLLIQH